MKAYPLLAICLLLLSGCMYPTMLERKVEASQFRTPYLVSEVIDGDTIELESGEMVRLIGINSPERDEAFYREAKDFLTAKLEGEIVYMEKDFENRDKYGRLLRYVFFKGENVNVAVVREGLARPMHIKPNVKYRKEIDLAYTDAKTSKRGIWQ